MNLKKSKRTIKYIVIHCSATPEGRHHTAKDIDLWHKQRGFSKIGYNYVIQLNGTIELGRDVDKIPAHVEKFNEESIGICYIGGCEPHGQMRGNSMLTPLSPPPNPLQGRGNAMLIPLSFGEVSPRERSMWGVRKLGGAPKDTRTPEQKKSLLKLLKELKKLYPNAEILGHRDFPNVKKACPSFDAKEEYKNL